jgi:hypothetical protein
MDNLTNTTVKLFDENDPETQPVRETVLDDQARHKLGNGASPPDK